MASLSARTAGLLGLAFLAALGGCSPIETYRAWNGIAQNDPDPAISPFVHNMAAAYDEPYPNLATVPPPPTTETSAAEREKLTQSLIADRQKAAENAVPATLPPAGGAPVGPPGVALASKRAAPPVPLEARAGHAAAARTAVAPPQDSTLRMPRIASLPQPQVPQPPPPAPQLAAIPVPPPVAISPAAIAGAAPIPPPAQPTLPTIAPPPPPPSLENAKNTAPAAPAPVIVARLDLRSAGTGGAEQAQIAHVAALYKEKPGAVRVVAYAAAPVHGGDPLASYQAALDRARGVKNALVAAGIPPGKISTEAKPAEDASGGAAGRIEIELTP